MLGYIAVPSFFSQPENGQTLAKYVYYELEGALAVYYARYGNTPQTFASFVTSDKELNGTKTLSLSHIQTELINKDLHIPESNRLKLPFKGGTAFYYLEGTKIKADYHF